jgi:hypothetical protein
MKEKTEGSGEGVSRFLKTTALSRRTPQHVAIYNRLPLVGASSGSV